MEAAATPESAAVLNDLAVHRQAEGKYPEAEALYKKSLSIWEATLGPDDPLVAQSLSNRAALYRVTNEHHEAERLFQMALRIWAKRGLPNKYERPLWADQFEPDLTLRNYGARVRSMRERLAAGDAAARAEIDQVIQRLGPWYHNVVLGPGVESNWWFATRSALKAMLRTAGFRAVEDTSNPEIFVCRK